MTQKLSVNRDRALFEIAEVEQALAVGHPPPGIFLGRDIQGAVRVVAERLNLSQHTLSNRVGTPERPGTYHKYFGLSVDWTKYKPPSPSEPNPWPAAPNAPSVSEPLDQIERRRYADENAKLKADLTAAHRQIVELQNVRENYMGLMAMPPTPVSFPSRSEGAGQAETVVLFLSDLQWGEHVFLDAMDGLNSFNLAIARNRLGRWANIVCDLCTKHWVGPPPDRIILILGGDLLSGAIFLELQKTDEIKPLPAARDVADHLITAINLIKETVNCPIDIISLSGNHGRTSQKPESKEAASTSMDVLVSDFLELTLRGKEGITFFVPASPDALFSVYGWRLVASHGDKTGSKGGHGFIGPAAAAARALKRMTLDYAARGIHLELILLAHWHTALQLEEGFVNGCLPGPTEYSRDGRFRPTPAVQLFFTMHPRHKIAQIRWIEVGDPSEGSLYEPPPVDRPLRPRFRVKAVTEQI